MEIIKQLKIFLNCFIINVARGVHDPPSFPKKSGRSNHESNQE